MQHRTIRVALFSAAGLVFAAGCDAIKINHHAVLEERATQLAETYCAVYQSCDCSPLATDAVHDDPEQCVSEEKTRLLAAFEEAEEDGLDFDAGCMNQLLARYQDLGCESFAAVQIELGNPLLYENFGCSLYHGDETDGICEPVPGTSWSDCASGWMCRDDNTCTPFLESTPEGEACVVNYSAYSFECDAGLVCDDASATCEPYVGAGEPCKTGGGHGMRCAPDHYCEPISEEEYQDGTCQPFRTGGEPCNPVADGFCLGWCVEVEGAGDPAVGVCVDIPAVCLYEDLQPHI
jgi:hypothetical protein